MRRAAGMMFAWGEVGDVSRPLSGLQSPDDLNTMSHQSENHEMALCINFKN